MFRHVWGAVMETINLLRSFEPMIAIEWPRNCTYWKLALHETVL